MKANSISLFRRVFQKGLKFTVWLIAFLVVIAFITLQSVDRSPIAEQDFYKETLQKIQQAEFPETTGEHWAGGWAKSNITPAKPASLVGYAPRGPYEFVEDSSFVKAITLTNSKTRIAWLNYEFLIVHPHLSQRVLSAIQNAKIPVDQVIFTATHTHAGFGGYMPGLLGKLAFGGLDEKIVEMIVDKSIATLQNSIATEDTVQVYYLKSDAGSLVENRFIKGAPIDPFVRQLILTKSTGQKASLITYSAHATCMSSKFMGLSGDYPSYLTEELETQDFELALFAAGTVGSHRPLSPGNTPKLVRQYALMLDSMIQNNVTEISAITENRIAIGNLPIALREPHFRISDNVRIRPWLFSYLLGETNPHFDVTLIGSTLMIASSGEISGVFYEKWETLAAEKNLNLIITTFNGGYIGYITPDELYDEHFHEVRETNWFGPGNGEYFDAMIQKIIEKTGSKLPEATFEKNQ
jgi:hypothetical protein